MKVWGVVKCAGDDNKVVIAGTMELSVRCDKVVYTKCTVENSLLNGQAPEVIT